MTITDATNPTDYPDHIFDSPYVWGCELTISESADLPDEPVVENGGEDVVVKVTNWGYHTDVDSPVLRGVVVDSLTCDCVSEGDRVPVNATRSRWLVGSTVAEYMRVVRRTSEDILVTEYLTSDGTSLGTCAFPAPRFYDGIDKDSDPIGNVYTVESIVYKRSPRVTDLPRASYPYAQSHALLSRTPVEKHGLD